MPKVKKAKVSRAVESEPLGKKPKTDSERLFHSERAFIAASNRGDRKEFESRMKSARSASAIHKLRTGRGLIITEEAVRSGLVGEEEESPMRKFMRSHYYPMYNQVPIPTTHKDLMQHLRDNPELIANIQALLDGAREECTLEPVEPQMATEMSLFIQCGQQLFSQNSNHPRSMAQSMPTPPPSLSRHSSFGQSVSSPLSNQSPSYDQNMASPQMDPKSSLGQTMSSPLPFKTPRYDQNMTTPPMNQTSLGQSPFSDQVPGYDQNMAVSMGRNPSTQSHQSNQSDSSGQSSTSSTNPNQGTCQINTSTTPGPLANRIDYAMYQNPMTQLQMNQMHQWNSMAQTDSNSTFHQTAFSQLAPTSTSAIEAQSLGSFAQGSMLENDESFDFSLVDFSGGQ
ncbi:d2c34fdf-7985-47c9-af88-ac712f8830b9 [Sclerotinia trifoliorum]|uniref:D2c34fdf-7985-47c9-af88-ac712f8830b9 n=1 Tax=Sclerotinia trifoliorum TaxID=28548 RepID=A0A8H2VQN8_9HELO|nr:d2c34fdf-7985-47c9-af88-ac712f8830b9 [Sclerotinia trifoliorum]